MSLKFSFPFKSLLPQPWALIMTNPLVRCSHIVDFYNLTESLAEIWITITLQSSLWLETEAAVSWVNSVLTFSSTQVKQSQHCRHIFSGLQHLPEITMFISTKRLWKREIIVWNAKKWITIELYYWSWVRHLLSQLLSQGISLAFSRPFFSPFDGSKILLPFAEKAFGFYKL